MFKVLLMSFIFKIFGIFLFNLKIFNERRGKIKRKIILGVIDVWVYWYWKIFKNININCVYIVNKLYIVRLIWLVLGI